MIRCKSSGHTLAASLRYNLEYSIVVHKELRHIMPECRGELRGRVNAWWIEQPSISVFYGIVFLPYRSLYLVVWQRHDGVVNVITKDPESRWIDSVYAKCWISTCWCQSWGDIGRCSGCLKTAIAVVRICNFLLVSMGMTEEQCSDRHIVSLHDLVKVF